MNNNTKDQAKLVAPIDSRKESSKAFENFLSTVKEEFSPENVAEAKALEFPVAVSASITQEY